MSDVLDFLKIVVDQTENDIPTVPLNKTFYNLINDDIGFYKLNYDDCISLATYDETLIRENMPNNVGIFGIYVSSYYTHEQGDSDYVDWCGGEYLYDKNTFDSPEDAAKVILNLDNADEVFYEKMIYDNPRYYSIKEIRVLDDECCLANFIQENY